VKNSFAARVFLCRPADAHNLSRDGRTFHVGGAFHGAFRNNVVDIVRAPNILHWNLKKS